MARMLKLIVIGLLALALLATGALWAFQRYGVHRFPTQPQVPEAVGLPGVEVLDFTSGDGRPGHVWVARAAEGRPWILSFHGNYAGIGGSMAELAPLIEAGYGVAMMQYRGTQGTAGHPSEDGFAADASALYDQFDAILGETVPSEARVLHGYSLGAGVASRLATTRPVAGVVLHAAPTRICLYLERRYRGVPLCRLMWRERYDVIDHLPGIAAPVLVVHGTGDATVPVAEAEENFAALPVPWGLRLLEGGHADLARHGLIEAMTEFVDAVTAAPAD